MRKVIPLLIFIPLMVHGQTEVTAPKEQTNPTPERNSPFFLKQSVTVTATRGELAMEKSPVSVSLITSEEMAVRHVQLLDQVLNTIPGVYAFRGKGIQDINAGVGMRGFGGRGSLQARVLVLVDGQPINDSYTGQVNWATLPVEEVERVEVVRGSFSALYGGNAMGGVVNILTKPITKRQAEIYGQLGNQESTRYGGRVAERFRERLGLSLAYDRLQTGGYPSYFVTSAGTAGSGGTQVTGAEPTLTTAGTPTFILGRAGNNWWNQHSFRLRSDYTFRQHTVGYLQFQRQWSGYGYDQYETFLSTTSGAPFDSGIAYTVWNGAPRRFTLTPSMFLPGDGQTQYWLLSGRIYHEFASGAQIQVGGGRTKSPLNYYSTPGSGASVAGGPGTISDRPYGSWFGTAQYTQRLSGRHHLTAGMDLRQDQSQMNETSVPNWTWRKDAATFTDHSQGQAYNQGIYAQDQWQVAERVGLVGGARYDYWKTYDGGYGVGPSATKVNSRSDQSGSAKIAALLSGPAGLTFRSSVGNSFRSPSVYDLYRTWRSSSGITYAANPNLEPERLLSVEAGVSRRWGNRLMLDAVFFQNRTSNLIYRSTDFSVDPTGKYRPVINAGRGRTNGFEAYARVPLCRWLYSTSSYGWNDAVIVENRALPDTVGKRVPFVPAHTATTSLFAFVRSANAFVTGRYVSRMYSTDLNTDTTKGVYGAYDPFFTLDAGVSVPIGPHISVELSADDLLNRIWYGYYPCPGRLVFARLRLRL
jgi:iron complex outermembrane receptor protein